MLNRNLSRRREQVLQEALENLYKPGRTDVRRQPRRDRGFDGTHYAGNSGNQEVHRIESQDPTISDIVDQTATERLKGTALLVTVNTNKRKPVIGELLSVGESEMSLGDFQHYFRHVVSEYLSDVRNYTPKIIGYNNIPASLASDLSKFLIQVDVREGEWEESTEYNGSKLHIHMGVEILIASEFKGFFHLDIKGLRDLLKAEFPALWGSRETPYVNVVASKNNNMSLKAYIQKMHAVENKTLIQRVIERINNYHKMKQNIENT